MFAVVVVAGFGGVGCGGGGTGDARAEGLGGLAGLLSGARWDVAGLEEATAARGEL